MHLNTSIELILVGLFVGTLVGLTGVGGGSVMTPLLVLVLGINPLVAVGTDLVYSVPTKLYGAFLHHRQGTVNWKIVVALLWGGIPAAIAGLVGLYWLRHHVDMAIVRTWTKEAIGYSIILAAVIILVRSFLKVRVPQTAAPVVWTRRRYSAVAAIGAVVGLILVLTSIGSGAVTLPLLSLVLPAVSMGELIGSDIAFAAFLIPVAAGGRWSMGDVNLPLALTLLVGSLPGVYIGSKLCARLDPKWLRPAVAVTLIVVAARMI